MSPLTYCAIMFTIVVVVICGRFGIPVRGGMGMEPIWWFAGAALIVATWVLWALIKLIAFLIRKFK